MSISVRVRVRFTPINRRAWMGVALFTVGLLLAFLAQRAIYESGKPEAGALFYICAFALLGAVWFRRERVASVQAIPSLPVRAPLLKTPSHPRAHPVRKLFAFPALLLTIIAFAELTGNRFTLPGTLAWLTALGLFLFAFWEGSPSARLSSLRTAFSRQSRWVTLALAGIVLIGAFFYFYRLDAIPAEMTSDHAEKILDTYDILHGTYSIFFERNTGREPLQFYMNALVVALGIAPLDMIALKIVGAFAGVLAIPGVFLLGRELFDDDIGLVAAFFFAVSIFPLAIARVGLRYPLSPLFVAWTCFFLVRAVRRRSRNDFLLAGLMMGLGLNGYSPFRVVVLLAFVWIALWLLWNFVPTRDLWRFLKDTALMFGAALLVFVPLLRYISEHPGNFAYRMATRLTSLEEPLHGDPFLTFLNNNWRAFGMFNLRGDVVWVNTVPNVPVVDWMIGACFLLGVLYGAYRLLRFREYPYALMFSALFVLLLPSTLALAFPEENPSVVRAGGVAPFIMLFAAVPLAIWRKQFVRLGDHILGNVLLGFLMLGTLLFNFNLYFNAYDKQYREAAWNSTEIAGTLRDFALEQNDWKHIYIVSAPHWVDHRAVGIHLGIFDFDAHLIENQATLRQQAKDPAPKLYALKNQDLEDLQLLKDLYPDGFTLHVDSRTRGRDFVAFYAPAR